MVVVVVPVIVAVVVVFHLSVLIGINDESIVTNKQSFLCFLFAFFACG